MNKNLISAKDANKEYTNKINTTKNKIDSLIGRPIPKITWTYQQDAKANLNNIKHLDASHGNGSDLGDTIANFAKNNGIHNNNTLDKIEFLGGNLGNMHYNQGYLNDAYKENVNFKPSSLFNKKLITGMNGETPDDYMRSNIESTKHLSYGQSNIPAFEQIKETKVLHNHSHSFSPSTRTSSKSVPHASYGNNKPSKQAIKRSRDQGITR